LREIPIRTLTIVALLLAAAPAAARAPVPLPTLSVGVQDATESTKFALTPQTRALMTVLSKTDRPAREDDSSEEVQETAAAIESAAQSPEALEKVAS
jgi:hypothetical protein